MTRAIPFGPVGGAFAGQFPNIEYPESGGIYFPGQFDPDNPPLGMVKYVTRLSHAEILTLVTAPPIILLPSTFRAKIFRNGLIRSVLPDGPYSNAENSNNGFLAIQSATNQDAVCSSAFTFPLLSNDGALANLIPASVPETGSIYAALLSLLDSTDAWIPYFANGVLGDVTGGGPNNYLEFQIWVEVIDVS